MRWFRVDLLDLGAGLSWRRVVSLVRQLPIEAATVSVQTGERQWGPVEHLLAMLIDAVSYDSWLFVSANAKKKPPVPKPIRRPGERVEKQRSALAPAEMAARLRAQQAREVMRSG